MNELMNVTDNEIGSQGREEMNVRQSGRTRGLGTMGLFLLGGAVAAAAFWGFTSRAQGAEQSAPVYQSTGAISVKTAPAAEGQITASLTYSAEVKAVSQVTVLPKGSGRIQKLLVDVGSSVKTGDPIAELDSDALKVQVSQAKANLAAAEAKLASMRAGSRGEQIAQAKASLEAAEARRDTVKKGATEADMQAAQSAVDAARANERIARARLDQLKKGATEAELSAALSAVDQAKAAIRTAQANLDEVKAGPKDYEIWAAQKDVDAARSALYAANDRVDTWKGTSSDAEKMATGATSTSQAVKGSEAAQATLDAAVSRLNYIKSRPTPLELQDAQGKLDTAKSGFEAAKSRLEQLQRGATSEEMKQAEGAVSAAEATLASAEARLKQLQNGPTAEDLKVAESGVTQAEQAYGLTVSPYTKNDVDMAKASVAQAQATVDLAEIALKESLVVSPVDGVVAERLQSVGNLVSPQTPIVSLISSDVELTLGVEEGQVGQLRVGQKAGIEVAAYPGEALAAKVALIAPSADAKTRTFQVKIAPEDKEGKLRQGMFAHVKIVTQEKGKAVLLPKDAVVTRSGESSVFVVNGDIVEKRSVKLGLAHDGTVEVVSGVNAGDEVVVAGQNELRDGDKVTRS